MKKSEREELRKLAEAATPGPWIGGGPSFGGKFPIYCDEVLIDREGEEDDVEMVCRAPLGLEDQSTENMSFIAAANPAAIQSLLAYVDRLESQRDRLLEALNNIVYVDCYGRYRIGFHGDIDVTRIVGENITEAESQS